MTHIFGSVGRSSSYFGLSVLIAASIGVGCGSDEGSSADSNTGAQTGADDGGAFCNALTVLRDNCTSCHNPDRVAGAPMSLLTYQDLMAPSFSDPTKPVYQLVGARIHDTLRPMPQPPAMLTPTAMAALDSWIAGGAQPGLDPTCAISGAAGGGAGVNGGTAGIGVGVAGVDGTVVGGTAGTGFAGTGEAGSIGAAGSGNGAAGTGAMDDGWPDDCEEKYTITAYGGSDKASKYSIGAGAEIHPQFSWTAPWGTGEVQAVKFRPIIDNASVLHHWILYGPPASGFGGANKFIAGWAPGSEGDDLPPNVGMYLPSGTLRLDVHYYNKAGSAAQQDKSGVEICVIKNKASFREFTAGVIGLTGSATANAGTTTATPVTCTAQVTGGPVTFLGVSPHMHKLGVHAYLALTKAGLGATPMVLHDAPFQFEDQRIWTLPNVQVSNGDKLTTTCTYDNTTDSTVRFGQDTDDEMCFNFTTYYPYGNLSCGTSL